MQFTYTKKGLKQLVLDGFTCIQNKKTENKIYWVCSMKRHFNCKATCISSALETYDQVLKSTGEHDHPVISTHVIFI